jgi:hypothetical protein
MKNRMPPISQTVPHVTSEAQGQCSVRVFMTIAP